MGYTGGLIALFTAVLWTASSLIFEYATKNGGVLNVNLLRGIVAIVFLVVTLFFVSGSLMPLYADVRTWTWMCISGIAGFVLCDICSFTAYGIITARYTQLIMTLSPPISALMGWLMLGQRLSSLAGIGMILTLFGIGFSIFERSDHEDNKTSSPHLIFPARGVILAIIAAIGQGSSVVFSKIGMDDYASSIEVLKKTADPSSNIFKLSQNGFYIPMSGTMMRMLAAVVCFTIFVYFRGGFKGFFTFLHDRKSAGLSGLGAFIGSYIGVILSLAALNYINAAVVSTILSTVPILILLPDHFINHRKVTARQIFGACVSVVGVALFFL
ncbi:MAG: EamA family transporter [Bacteroidales bacterium]|nr:EamA family transporter [Bacteroidales bacterium]MDD4420966.1 EamA family transporter [Bacteroidales bacterium]